MSLNSKKTPQPFKYSLIDGPLSNFKNCNGPDNFPTNKEVLQVFCHYHIVLEKTIPESCSIVAVDLLNVWSNSSIALMDKKNIIPKLKSLYIEYFSIRKNLKNNFRATVIRRHKFIDKLYEKFNLEKRTAKRSSSSAKNTTKTANQKKIVLPPCDFEGKLCLYFY